MSGGGEQPGTPETEASAGASSGLNDASGLNKPCRRPACEGRYEDTGVGETYCDTSGLAPVVAPGGMLGAAPTGLTCAARGDGAAAESPSSSAGSAASAYPSRFSARSSARSGPSRRSVSGRIAQDLSGQSTARAASVRSSTRSGASGSGRGRLGAGLVSVREASIHCTAARVAAVRARLRQRAPHEPLLDDLYAAAQQVERLRDVGLDAPWREALTAEVLGSALDWTLAGRDGASPAPPVGPASARLGPLLGSPLDETGLRHGLERSYRLPARLAQSGTERIELVERANRFRPRTWV